MIPWSQENKKLLLIHYPQSGTRELIRLMPHRTKRQIRAYAHFLGLVSEPHKRNMSALAEKPWTEAEDAYMRKTYPLTRKRTRPRTSKAAIAKTLKRSIFQISKRAAKLGLIRLGRKQPDWTDDEIEFLADHCGRSTAWLRAAMKRHGWPDRSETGIAKKRDRLGYAVNGNGRVYSAAELGRLMGTSGRMVGKWIKDGLLDAKPRSGAVDPNHGGVGDRWEIKPEAVKRFVFRHSAHFDLSAVHKDWFLSVLEPDNTVRPTLRQSACGVEGAP